MSSSLDPGAEEFVPGRPFGYGAPSAVLSVTDEVLEQARPGEDLGLHQPSPPGVVPREVTSTPVAPTRGRPLIRISPVHSRGPRLTNRDWSYMPGRRNKRRRRNLCRRIVYSDEDEVDVGPEINKKKTGLRWKQEPVDSKKFVDDGIMISKVNMDSASPDGPAKLKHDLLSQNVFRRVVRKAESRGMVVNKGKTKMLCISDAQSYKARSYLLDGDGSEIKSSESMKILGFHLDSRPSAHAHISALKKRMRDTTWILRHLKLAGFNQEELATVYRTIVRPVLDYCAVVYHPLLNDEQDQAVERLQAQELKNIYGYRISYAQMREKAKVTTHRARRIELCDAFARKAAANPRFAAWFPERSGRCGRHSDQYKEFNARTDRLYNSPLFYYRRRLNGKPGKTYGQRNKEYRE